MKNPCIALLVVTVVLSGCAAPRGTPQADTANAVAAPATGTAVASRSSGVIELKNGTVLVGTVEKEEAGKLYIEAGFIGRVVIDASAEGRHSARLDAQRLIILKNKSRLVGTIYKEEGGKLFVDADLIGRVVIDAANVARRGQ